MIWWLVIVFCPVPMAQYPDEDGLPAPDICVGGTYHDKLPDEPIAPSCHLNGGSEDIYVP